MNHGTLYGIGVGPGDPELLTLKAARLLGTVDCVYVPRSHLSKQDFVTAVALDHARCGCAVEEIDFSMAKTPQQRQLHWEKHATTIAARLRRGENVAFVTLGDATVYSTWIYLVRALRQIMPAAAVETIPGVSSFSLAAALTTTALGEGDRPLTVIPAASDHDAISAAVNSGGVVIMKIGHRLREVVTLLDDLHALERSVFVARAGLPGQRVETDLRPLAQASHSSGNLAVIIVAAP